jgi:hypothetical protein
VSLAFRGDERAATLVAIPGLPDDFVRAVDRNARETDAVETLAAAVFTD